MEIKRCVRCGCLYTTKNEVCNECSVKDNVEVGKLRVVLEEGLKVGTTKLDLAVRAGITAKNLDRYLKTDEFSDIYFPETSNNIPDNNIINGKMKV